MLVLVWTVPKVKLDGFAVKEPAVTPLPESVQVNGDPGAFEAIVTVPDALAVDAGVKVTLKVVLWPAVKVNGVVMPLRANPLPAIVALLIVTLDPPLFVMVAVCFWFLPICTVPNAMMFDPVVSDPGVTPVPERATLKDAFEASLVMATFPTALPAVVGANFTEKLALCPAAMVAGMLMPLIEKPVPVTAA